MTDKIDPQAAFVQLVLADLAAFASKHERPLTETERMSFIAGHAAGFTLGRDSERLGNEDR